MSISRDVRNSRFVCNQLQQLSSQQQPRTCTNARSISLPICQRAIGHEVANLRLNNVDLKLTPQFMQKSVPYSQNEPIFADHPAAELLKSRGVIKRSYVQQRKSQLKVKCEQIEPQESPKLFNARKTFRRQLKLAFDPVQSFTEGSQDTTSRADENFSAFSTNPKRRDFLDANERLRFERQLTKSETNIDYLAKNYEQMLQTNLDLLIQHRANHLQKILDLSITIKKTEIPFQIQQLNKLLKQLKNYFFQLETASLSLQIKQKLKLPELTTNYFKLLQKCPQRKIKADLRSGELNPRSFEQFQAEFRDECVFNQFITSQLSKRQGNVWNQQRLQMLFQLEKMLSGFIFTTQNSFQLQQVVKFTDELRKGVLIGDLQINQVEEEILDTKNQITDTIDKIQDQFDFFTQDQEKEAKILIRNLITLKNNIKHAVTSKQRDTLKELLLQYEDIINQ